MIPSFRPTCTIANSFDLGNLEELVNGGVSQCRRLLEGGSRGRRCSDDSGWLFEGGQKVAAHTEVNDRGKSDHSQAERHDEERL